MLLDNALFIPKAWLRFIPNPDMLQTWKKTKWGNYTINNTTIASIKEADSCRRVKWCNLSKHMRLLQNLVYLFMVKGWRAGCCLGMQMILGELRLGLPSPELPILLVLPLIPMPWPTWVWFSMFLEFIGNVPLSKHCQVWFSCIILSFSTVISVLRHLLLQITQICMDVSLQQVNTFIHTCLVMEEYGGTWWGPRLWGWYDLVAVCLVLDFGLTEAYCSPCPLLRNQVHLQTVRQEKNMLSDNLVNILCVGEIPYNTWRKFKLALVLMQFKSNALL